MEAARHCASRFRSKSTDPRPVDFALGSQRDAHAGKLNWPSPSRCLTRPFRPRSSTKPHADNVFIRLAGLPVAVGRRIEVTADLGWVRVWCLGDLVADHDRSAVVSPQLSAGGS